MDAARINSDIRRRFVALVASAGRPTSDLAEAMGIDEKRLRRILDGRNPLSAAEIVLAARHLGVITSVITGEIKYDHPAAKYVGGEEK